MTTETTAADFPRKGNKYLIRSSGVVRSGVYEVIGPQEHNGLYPCRKLDAKMKPMAYLDFDRIRACGGSVIATS